jgi:hypothetical protein
MCSMGEKHGDINKSASKPLVFQNRFHNSTSGKSL